MTHRWSFEDNFGRGRDEGAVSDRQVRFVAFDVQAIVDKALWRTV